MTPTPKQKIERLIQDLEEDAKFFRRVDRPDVADIFKHHANRLREILKEWE